MPLCRTLRVALILSLFVGLAACGGRRAGGGSGLTEITAGTPLPAGGADLGRSAAPQAYTKSSIFDVFGPNRSDQVVNVNRYLWAASLDVLSFLPVQNADPFSGVIQFGYGTPPGGGRAYQATVLIQDPALDARSLNVALRTRGGAVSRETQRSIEDAILTRARQLRVRDSGL